MMKSLFTLALTGMFDSKTTSKDVENICNNWILLKKEHEKILEKKSLFSRSQREIILKKNF